MPDNPDTTKTVIVRDPHMCSGRPTIRGTRMTPANVVGNLEGKASLQEFLNTWTYIDTNEIYACLRYCANQECRSDDDVKYCIGCEHDREPDDPDDEPGPRRRYWLIAASLQSLPSSPWR